MPLFPQGGPHGGAQNVLEGHCALLVARDELPEPKVGARMCLLQDHKQDGPQRLGMSPCLFGHKSRARVCHTRGTDELDSLYPQFSEGKVPTLKCMHRPNVHTRGTFRVLEFFRICFLVHFLWFARPRASKNDRRDQRFMQKRARKGVSRSLQSL